MYLIAAFQIGTLPLTELSRPIAVIRLEISPVKNETILEKDHHKPYNQRSHNNSSHAQKSNIRLTGFKLL